MKSTLSYFVTFFMGALFGAFLLFNLWQPSQEKQASSQTNNIKIKRFDKDFKFDPARKKRKDRSQLSIADQMDRDIEDFKNDMNKVFDNKFFQLLDDSLDGEVFESIGGPVGKITEKITKDAVILELDVSRIDNSSLKIEVRDGQVSINGESQVVEDDGHTKRQFKSSFSRIYPVPEGTDPAGLRIESKGKNILQLVFPKV